MKDVTAAIILQKGNVFIARRAPKEKHAGGWEFPGGKIESGETPEECLKRELFEEFGIYTKINDFIVESIYDYPKGTIRLLAYLVDVIDGDINLNVHDAYDWVEPHNLQKYNLLPADIPIAMKLNEVV